MDHPAIPQDHVSWSSFDLLPLASFGEEPVDLRFGEMVRIDPFPSSLRRFVLVRLEKLVIKRERSLKNHQSSVVRSVLELKSESSSTNGRIAYEVDDTLYTMFETSVWRLIDMWPRTSVDWCVFCKRQGDVDTVLVSARRFVLRVPTHRKRRATHRFPRLWRKHQSTQVHFEYPRRIARVHFRVC